MNTDTPLRWTLREGLLAAAACALLATAAIALGLPRPAADDLMFTGAAFSLATGGGLQNPLLASQFGTADFLVYPPFYFDLLGLWLRVSGISTGALLLFQHACYAVAGGALTVWLSRRVPLAPPRWLWPALFAAGLLAGLGRMGLRPEAAGVAAFAAGLALRDGVLLPARLGGWLLIGGSMLVSPHMLVFGTGTVLAIQLLDTPQRPRPAAEWKLAGLAALLLFGLFAWSIGGRLGDFLESLRHHASRTSLPLPDALAVVRRQLAENTGHALAAAAAAVTLASGALAARRGRGRIFCAALTLAVATAATSALLDVSRHELRIALVIIWSLGCAACLLSFLPRLAWLATALVAIALVWDLRGNAAALGPRGRPDSAQLAAAHAAAARDPERRFLVDSFAARYVFDYRLPANARDWTFARPFPRMWPQTPADIRADETWIVAGYNLHMIDPASAPTLEPIVTMLGRSLNRRSGDYDLFLIDGRSPAAPSR